ncbi:hypothetical protein H9Y04_15910 [Streptomyces sp. TRM66268-LWL]|uniref:Uncharacterized protein n=1 Tax=Streptomyces polyasparticus TaxID=2767826 RepID=A0ABR7SEX6_9ACTN|nr:hypothetical protein [Streptomyces polyasparticus]MBC9714050.1 hypothetical protein [Streptomyces polyasparticus]
MTRAVIPKAQAFANARAALDAARARRDSMPIRAAAEAAAAGSRLSADEIELIIRRLRRQAQSAHPDLTARPAAA